MDINIDGLSDEQLKHHLKQHGLENIAIQDTTRDLYRNQLKKRIRQSGSGGSSKDRSSSRVGIPTKKRRIEQSPKIPYKVNNRRGQNPSPRYQSSYRGTHPLHSPVAANNPRLTPDKPRPMPKLAAESKLSIDNDFSFNMNQSELWRGKDYHDDDSYHEEDVDYSQQVSLSPLSDHDDVITERESDMELGTSPVLRRKPIRRQGSGQWIDKAVNLIGKGVSYVSSLVSRESTSTDEHSPRRTGGNRYRYHDSVDIGNEVEIGRDTNEDNRILLQPSAPSRGSVQPSAPSRGSLQPTAPPLPVAIEHGTIRYDWELLPSDVQICVCPDGTKWCLGKGGFGEVFKGIKDGIDEVAIKVIKIQNHTTSIEQFKREIDLISKLRHRNILQFYGACIKPQCLYMVTELMQSDLFTALRTNRRYQWSGAYGKEVCIGIVTGIHYLHSRRPPIVHRDIKSPNILLMDGLAKIADVGIARAKMDSDMTAQRGFTIAWAAPEVIYRRRATEKIDVWSYGIILWEVVTGRPPNPGRLVMPTTAPYELTALYNNCTEEDPLQRPITGDILVSLKNMS